MITFIDAVMGSGKSTYAIKYINQNKNTKFIIAAITLSEVERYSQACNIAQPTSQFSKMNDLVNLIQAGASAVITHKLLLDLNKNPQSLKLIRDQGYHLVLDEVLSSPIYPIAIEENTLDTCSSANLIGISNVDERITWIASSDYQDRVDLRDACLNDDVYRCNGCHAIGMIKRELFDAFQNISILTYMAEFSLLYKYFEIHRFAPVIKTLDNNELSSNKPIYSGKQFAHLINLDSKPRRNSNSVKLSASALSKINQNNKSTITSYISGFFTDHQSIAGKPDRLWTTYKSERDKLSCSRAKPMHDQTNFLQHTSRGTNDYQNVIAAAYVLDKYLNPGVTKFLKSRGLSFKRKHKQEPSGEDMWALSEMLQWIWRTRVRQSKNIWLYIPAPRMRRLLEEWLK